MAARMPGVRYASIATAFDAYNVVKASNLRGTVHTSTAEQHAWLAAACDEPRDRLLTKHLKLEGITARAVTDEIEHYASGEWCERTALTDHMWEWLEQQGTSAERGPMPDNLLWGHPWLVRRPRDGRWERRTDVLHRSAATVLGVGRRIPAHEALERLVRLHLGAYGPATRRDVAWWLGGRLTRVDEAITRLSDELVQFSSDGPDPYLDLAEPPRGGTADPGVRLLPEFDGLLLGYAPANRRRFVDPEHFDRIWLAANGLFSPVVLRDGRIAATWRLRSAGSRHALEVTLLPGQRSVSEDELAGPIGDVGSALAIEVSEVRVLS